MLFMANKKAPFGLCVIDNLKTEGDFLNSDGNKWQIKWKHQNGFDFNIPLS
jgi:hypothetical protein